MQTPEFEDLLRRVEQLTNQELNALRGHIDARLDADQSDKFRWHMDALEYQQMVRAEWDEVSPETNASTQEPGCFSDKRAVVYRVTFPNGKIYVGQDTTDTPTYFGSVSPELVRADFSFKQRESFTLTKDILWWSESPSEGEVWKVEQRFIQQLAANDPSRGYNRLPKWVERS